MVDAVVVGAGPNGLTAAIILAEAGLEVHVHEAGEAVGGGARTEELTLPGFHHDPCSAVHPLGVGSPVFARLPLEQHGLEWLEPPLQLAHPFPDGSGAFLARSAEETAAGLGTDGDAYLGTVGPFLGRWDDLTDYILGPVVSWPAHPLLLARFGLRGGPPATVLARRFHDEHTRGLVAGLAAHAIAPLTAPATAGVALLFAVAAHEVGWPLPKGGSQAISDALAAHLRSLGGSIVTGHRVRSMQELPAARAYLFDTSPTELVSIAGDRLSPRYARRLSHYLYGPAVYKVDYALDGPVPWTSEVCRRAGTVHLGPSFPEIASALTAAGSGDVPDPPFLVTAQPSVVDDSRAPAGKQVFWAYAHVPHGWKGDLTDALERQVERFAPGFRDLVLARNVAGPPELEARNPNYVGGDIACGRVGGVQAFMRPVVARVPYATSDPGLFLCSSATPPGPGVHGMCGYHAARVVLERVFHA